MADAPKMIHAMLRVREEARSLDFYARALGLAVADRYAFEDFTLIYLANAESGFELELTVNTAQDKDYEVGNGYGHIAVSVADLEATHRRMADQGLSPKDIKELTPPSGGRARFFFIEDPDGYKIEVLQRGWRFR